MKNPEYMIKNSQKLRTHMTKEELHLWLDFLKKCPYSVRRQKVMGNYILDFYIPEAKIAIELDGRQHGKEENRESDRERDSFLAKDTAEPNPNGESEIHILNADFQCLIRFSRNILSFLRDLFIHCKILYVSIVAHFCGKNKL